MQLQINTTYQPATDLGYLLSKNPVRHQEFNLAFGVAHVFYPEATAERCSVALVVDVDPVGLVRGRGDADGPLTQYVNDRPYTASSFLSVAIAQVFSSAMAGTSKGRSELAASTDEPGCGYAAYGQTRLERDRRLKGSLSGLIESHLSDAAAGFDLIGRPSRSSPAEPTE